MIKIQNEKYIRLISLYIKLKFLCNIDKKVVNDDIIKVFVSKRLQRNTLKHIVLVSEKMNKSDNIPDDAFRWDHE